MKYYTYCFVLMVLYGCASAQSIKSNCNQTLRYLSLKSKLDSTMCIPRGYQIMDIINVDVDDNGYPDKVVKWQKIKLSDGDTTFFSIYSGHANGEFLFHKTFNNLYPLYFKDYEAKSSNQFYDSIKFLYYYPTLSEVNFSVGTITLKFYVDAANVRELVFHYMQENKSWLLSREIGWIAPIQNNTDPKKNYDRKPSKSMLIENFNMLEYINW